MTVLPMVLIVVGVLLLLALAAGLLLQRRRTAGAVPPGPRTVADLVSRRAAETAHEPAPPASPAVVAVVPSPAADPVDDPADADAAPPAAASSVVGPALSAAGPGTAAVGPLGDDVPWRRAAHMATAHDDPDVVPEAVPEPPAEPYRVPALAPLRRPVRRDPVVPAPESRAERERGLVVVAAAVPVDGDSSVGAPTEAPDAVEPPGPEVEPDAERSVTPVGPRAAEHPVFPDADPDIMFDSPPAPEPSPPAVADAPATPVAAIPADDPAGEAVLAAEPVVAGWPVPQDGRPRRDPARVAAEQAAADLALLRTFGSADLGSRPDRAPVVSLEGCDRPEREPAAGAAQPVRFRAVRRDRAAIPDVAVALLDDRGRESSAGRSDAAGAGELSAPHPGSYVLVATALDHQPGAVALTVGDAPVDAVVLLVRSASLVGTVSGEDGPIAGAMVTLVQDGEVVGDAETGVDGRYRVADMAAGEYALSVAAAGCEPHVTLVAVPDEAELGHDVDLEPAGVPAG